MNLQIGEELKLGSKSPEELGFKRLDFDAVNNLRRFESCWIYKDRSMRTLVLVEISFVERGTGLGFPNIYWQSIGNTSGQLQFLESSGWQPVFQPTKGVL